MTHTPTPLDTDSDHPLTTSGQVVICSGDKETGDTYEMVGVVRIKYATDIMTAVNSHDKLVEVLKQAFDRLNHDTPICTGSFLHQDIMVALEEAGAIEKTALAEAKEGR